jgi:uncharacterized membrane protein YccC
MSGLVVLILALAGLAGGCAFLIDYEKATYRFPRERALRHGLRTALVTTVFFAVLGLLLVVALLP